MKITSFGIYSILNRSMIKYLKKAKSFGIKANRYFVVVSNLRKTDFVGIKPIYFFNHIPKCGGTSLLRILQNWFFIIRDYPPHDLKFKDAGSLENAFELHKNSPRLYEDNPPWKIIAGHYHEAGLRFEQRYPGLLGKNKRVRLITFLRDPLEHRISLYYHGLKKGHAYVTGYVLKDYILNEVNKNFYAQALGCTVENYKNILDDYFFIGILEDFERSIQVLADITGKRLMTRIPHMNTSHRSDEVFEIQQVIDEFKRANSLDYQIYEYCRGKMLTKT